jgi:DNA-binding transcriptional MocR family regulator
MAMASSRSYLLQYKSMNVTARNTITGSSAVEIARSVERALRQGALEPGARLPTVRALAGELGVSPATVASAYRALRQRGLLVGEGRRGSAIAPAPPLGARAAAPLPPHARDLTAGNPDAALLPDLHPVLAKLDATPHLYGGDPFEPALIRLARRQLEADGLPARALAVTSGALDGIERVLQAHLRPGDRVVVEDPGFISVFDLLRALALVAVPVAVDDSGVLPDALERALASGAHALILTPRAQNPFGSALDARRAREIRRVLREFPDALLIEDDHAAGVAGAPLESVGDGRARFAFLRSVSKGYGPDLRLAILSGDPETVARVEGRQRIGMRWVSHLLQRLVVALGSDRGVASLMRRAERTYTERRNALVRALAARGVPAHGRSGMNVWIPVVEEAPALAALLERGWALAPGERFRLRTRPAIRATIATLDAADAEKLAADVAEVLAPSRRTLTV